MFTWFNLDMQHALLGGLIIGTAASLLMIFNGRIAGISSILGGMLSPTKNNFAWRVFFILGLIASPWIYTAFQPLPIIEIKTSPLLLVISGFLVGFGTQLGNGCTSGHGVCGIARGSKRSIIATITFIAFGMLTVYLIRFYL